MSATATADPEAPTTRLPVAGTATDPGTPDAADPPGRIPGIDAARGVALLGMMAVHALFVVDDRGAPTAVGLIASGNARRCSRCSRGSASRSSAAAHGCPGRPPSGGRRAASSRAPR